MRVLILSAILAAAAAAPSVAPVAVIPAAVPTIDPGDIQAAAINAQVFAEDQARALNDKLIEANNEKVTEINDQAKEKAEETFWAVEDKKWQALDEAQTVNAKIDGAVASNADNIAKSALIVPGFVLPQPIPLATLPTGPVLYAAPALIPNKEEENKELVKTAEPEKQKPEEAKLDKKEDLKDKLDKPIIAPLIAPVIAPGIKFPQPWVAPIAPVGSIAPVAPFGAIAPLAQLAYLPQPLVAPVIKTQW